MITQDYILKRLSTVIALSFLIEMVISWKLWVPINRTFPMVSTFKGLDFSLYVIGDSILTAAIFIVLLGIILQKLVKLCTIALLCCLSILILEDITRLQAWVYTQGILLLILSQNKKSRTKSILTGVLLLTALVYIWSGIQKMNLGFITQTFPWMLSTFGLDVQSGLYQSYPIIYYLFFLAPLYELTLGVFLLFSRTRKIGFIMGILMHIFILVSLGPTGHHWNIIIWPWNISLIVVLLLFYRLIEPINLFKGLQYPTINWIIILLFGAMPALNFIGYWGKPLSGSLYSGTDSTIYFYYDIKEAPAFERLKIETTTTPESNPKDEVSKIAFMHWSMSDIQIPYYQSTHYFKRYGKKMCALSKFPEASRIEITSRSKFKNMTTITNCSCLELLESIQ